MKTLLSLAALCAFSFTSQAAYLPPASIFAGSAYGFSANSVTPTNIRSANLGVGTTDLITVPAGKRLLVASCHVTTTNAAAGAVYLQLKTNSVYYRFSASGTPAVGAQLLVGVYSETFLFEPGEGLSISNATAGANVYANGFLFPTNLNVYSPRLFTVGLTNLLYTCPAGKCAVGLPGLSTLFTTTRDISGNPGLTATYINDSGSSRTPTFYLVPSGDSPSGFNAQLTASIADKSRQIYIAGGGVLFPGDSLACALDATTATQWLRTTVVEIPFP